MPTFTAPDLPPVLSLRQWQVTKHIPDEIKKRGKLDSVLAQLAKAFQHSSFEELAPFFKRAHVWPKYNHANWVRECDELVRNVVVDGVINLREALGQVRNAVAQVEKSVDKKDPLQTEGIALLRQMTQAAEALLKNLRPETIEASIREKEKDVAESMFAIAGKPLEEIKIHLAKAKSAASLVMREPTAETYNKHIGSGGDGLTRQLATTLALLGTLPSAKGIKYEGATESTRIAKELASQKPPPSDASKENITARLKSFLLLSSDAAKLPRLPPPDS